MRWLKQDKLLRQILTCLHRAAASPSSLSTTQLLHTTDNNNTHKCQNSVVLTKQRDWLVLDFTKPEVSVPILLNPKVSTFVGVFFTIIFFPELFLHEPCPNGHPRSCDFVGGDDSEDTDLPELDPAPQLELLRLESVVDSVTDSTTFRLLSPNRLDPSNPIQLFSIFVIKIETFLETQKNIRKERSVVVVVVVVHRDLWSYYNCFCCCFFWFCLKNVFEFCKEGSHAYLNVSLQVFIILFFNNFFICVCLRSSRYTATSDFGHKGFRDLPAVLSPKNYSFLSNIYNFYWFGLVNYYFRNVSVNHSWLLNFGLGCNLNIYKSDYGCLRSAM